MRRIGLPMALAIVAVLHASCGSDEDGDVSGSAGAAGSESTGGTTGEAGSTGTGGEATLQPPSVDCSTRTGDYCIAVSALIDGTPIEFACLADTAGYRSTATIGADQTWGLDCNDNAADRSIYLSFPVQETGPFSITITGDEGGAIQPDVRLSEREMGKVSSSDLDNFVTATISGEVIDALLVIGTFSGTWSTPSADCGDMCAAIQVQGNFRSQFW